MFVALTVDQFKNDRIGEGFILSTKMLYTAHSVTHMVRESVRYAELKNLGEIYIGEYVIIDGTWLMEDWWFVYRDSRGWWYKERKGKAKLLLNS